jgi:broad specificity phosphatase PhoE
MTARTRVLLVRHGQTTWNAQGRWQGQLESPLSPLGRRQAAEAARAVGALDAIVASDLTRAADTAAIIAESLGVGPVRLDARLRERDVGEWQGLTRREIEARFPGDLDAWRTPPGFEHDDDVAARATAALTDLHAVHPGTTVLAVTHGGVIRALARVLGDGDGWVGNLHGRWVDVTDVGIAIGTPVELIDHAAVAELYDRSEQDLG